MKTIKINFGKVAFLMCNIIFLLSGICLVFLGCVLVNDTPRILLSRLVIEPDIITQPLLYYVALAFIMSGLAICCIAVLGCWASCTPPCNWLMGPYMLALIVLLLVETSFGVVALLCPQVIGVSADRDRMVTALMNNYGVPGKSQYTIAVDLAQTLFECCGMQSGSDYDGSRWWRREQETHHDLRVPLSCCFLINMDDENSFLDPKPINSSLCQAKTNSRYQHGRHVKGCIDKLNSWFKEHITIFLIIGLALIVVQLAVLLCAILMCLKKKAESSTSNIKAQKNIKILEKNKTPRPERKKTVDQIDNHNDIEFIIGESEFTDKNFPIDTNSYFSKKKIQKNEVDEQDRKNSPSLPLVLRNDHFQKYDTKIKENIDFLYKDSIMQGFENYDQTSDIYFTPHQSSTQTRNNKTLHKNLDQNREAKTYFGQNEHFGLIKSRYKEDQQT